MYFEIESDSQTVRDDMRLFTGETHMTRKTNNAVSKIQFWPVNEALLKG